MGISCTHCCLTCFLLLCIGDLSILEQQDWLHYYKSRGYKTAIFSIHPALHLALSSVLSWIVENLSPSLINTVNSEGFFSQFLIGKYSVKVNSPLPRGNQGWGRRFAHCGLGMETIEGLWASSSPGMHWDDLHYSMVSSSGAPGSRNFSAQLPFPSDLLFPSPPAPLPPLPP